MLKARILTALVVAPPVLAVMFFAPPVAFEALVALAIVGGAWEWSGLMTCRTRAGRWIFTGIIAALVVAVAAWIEIDQQAFVYVIVAAFAWWLFALGWVMLRPTVAPGCVLQGVCGALTLVPTFAAMVALHTWDELGPWRVLYLLALVWVADVGAYFAGHAFGRHKLAPRVSPGKTWEGVAGAFAAAAVVVAVGLQFGIAFGAPAAFAALSLAVVAFSIVGDLAESMMKRHHGVKDSGTLLPGHGGLLDRIDSLTAATPLFVGGMLWLG